MYNDISSYVAESNSSSGLYSSYAASKKQEVKIAEKNALDSIQAMYDEISKYSIENPPTYNPSVSVSGLTYDESIQGAYTFNSTTALRNIEPWGFKYQFSVNGKSYEDFAEYGAVVFNDVNDEFTETGMTVQDLLTQQRSAMYSSRTGNMYVDGSSMVAYHVGKTRIANYDKNTYAVFFVKDSSGNYYYSNVTCNSYKSLCEASSDTISTTILNYASAMRTYLELLEQ